jgi:hypothetical protein
MSKICYVCQHTYSDDDASCPFCATAAGSATGASGLSDDALTPVPHPAEGGLPGSESDPEIDLGQPVIPRSGNPNEASGASLIGWESLLRPATRRSTAAGDDPPVRIATLSSAEIRLVVGAPTPSSGTPRPAPVGKAEDPAIDLGDPVRTAENSSGPASGASIYSWSLLLPTARLGRPRREEPPVRFSPPDRLLPSSAGLPVETTGRDGTALRLQAVLRRLLPGLAGALIAVVLCVMLWTLGIEPPASWREQVRKWLAPPAAAPAQPAEPGP